MLVVDVSAPILDRASQVILSMNGRASTATLSLMDFLFLLSDIGKQCPGY